MAPIEIDPITGAPVVTPPTPSTDSPFVIPTDSNPPVQTEPLGELSGSPDDGTVFTPEKPLFSTDESVTKTDDEKKTKAAELLVKMNAKLQDVGGESNMGVTDEYWDWLREYRKLTTK